MRYTHTNLDSKRNAIAKLEGFSDNLVTPCTKMQQQGSKGRAAAVADVFGLHLSGPPAWLVWAFIHLMYLVTFQSRILVFIQWAIQHLTFNRSARLITGVVPTDFNLNEELASLHSTPQLKLESH
jgi:hypothetical protein